MTSTEQSEAARERFSLVGSTIWVPGGSGSLGAIVSAGLAEHGAHVVVSGRNAEKTAAAVKAITDAGNSAEGMTLDVSDETAVAAQAEDIVRRRGGLDGCVNLAYFATGKTSTELTAADWEAGMRVSSLGAFLVGRAAANVMESGGSIVQFGSMYGVVSPDPRNYPATQPVNPPDYGFAKAGILQLVRYQAAMLGDRNIRVNAVVPGPFPGTKAQGDAEFISRLAARVPLGRVGRAEELVGAVVFLCSRASSYVTGSSLVVDGGWTAW